MVPNISETRSASSKRRARLRLTPKLCNLKLIDLSWRWMCLRLKSDVSTCLVMLCLLSVCIENIGRAQETPTNRLQASQQLFLQSQQPIGLLVPLYHYPANVHTNVVYNQLIALKKKYPTVPVCAIINIGNGPGKVPLDANYVKAVDRLHGAGVILIGYVSTRYGQQPPKQVMEDIRLWQDRSEKITGIFLDEMANENKRETVNYYGRATAEAHRLGFWPVFANPGTATPEPYFAAKAADIFIIHENDHWPKEAELRGDYFGGYADYPPSTRGILIHTQHKLDTVQFETARQYVRWIYVTNDKLDNPWDDQNSLLEELFLAAKNN